MDKIDRKILSLLQENARYPLKYLAQKVFLSSPAVSTRIERMEKAGIITGYHATIDPAPIPAAIATPCAPVSSQSTPTIGTCKTFANI